MKEAVIVSGGNINGDFALDFLKQKTEAKGRDGICLLAADRGLEFFGKTSFVPDVAVGDFDSLSPEGQELLQNFEGQGMAVCRLRPEKDDSDTQSALMQAVSMGMKRIFLLGATGGRIDHLLANLELLSLGEALGAEIIMVDEQNCISLIPSGTKLARESQFGRYVSFFPVGGDVTELTLTGFKYPLTGHHLTVTDCGLTLSNEITEDSGTVTYDRGSLLMIQSKD